MAARIYVDVTSDFTPPEADPWRKDAACLGKDLKQFFPETKQETADAKEFCKTHCKRRVECLMFIMKVEKPKKKEQVGSKSRERRYGIYGGLDPKERRELQKALDKAKEGNNNG